MKQNFSSICGDVIPELRIWKCEIMYWQEERKKKRKKKQCRIDYPMLFFVHKIYCHSTLLSILLSIFLLQLSHIWPFSSLSTSLVLSNTTFHMSQNCLVKRFNKPQVVITTVALWEPHLHQPQSCHLNAISRTSPCNHFQKYSAKL